MPAVADFVPPPVEALDEAFTPPPPESLDEEFTPPPPSALDEPDAPTPTDSPNMAGAKAAWEALNKPFVAVPRVTGAELKQAYPFLSETSSEFIAGTQRGVAGLIEGVENPLGAAVGVAGVGAKFGMQALTWMAKTGAAAYAALMAKHLPEGAAETEVAFQQKDWERGMESAIGTAASAVLVPVIAGHLAPRGGPRPLVPFIEETSRAAGAPIVPRGAAQEASAAPMVAKAVSELPPIIKEVKAPETPKTPEPWQMTREEFAVQDEPSYPATYRIEIDAVANGVKPAHYGFYPADKPWASDVYGEAKQLGLYIKKGPRKNDYIITPDTESGRSRAATIYTHANENVLNPSLMDDVKWHDRFAKLLGYGPEFEGRIQAISGPTTLENKRLHRYYVSKALREGKSIPSNVIADYPDLKPAAMAEDMGAVLMDAHEMAGAKVKSLTGFTEAEGEIIRGKLEDWVREEAEKFQAANGTLDRFLPEKVISTRVNTAIEFVQAQKRGGGAVKVELDKPTEEGGTVGEVIPDSGKGPASAAAEVEVSERIADAVDQLPPEERQTVRDFMSGGTGTLSRAIAAKLGPLLAERGIGVGDLQSMAGPGGTIRADVGVAKSELNQLADSLTLAGKAKGEARPSTVLADLKDSVASKLSKVQDVYHGAVAYLKDPPPFTDFQRSIGVWSRERQESGRDVYYAWKKVKETMPDRGQRDAIGAYVDSGGDRAMMEKAAKELPEKFARNYRRALALTPEEIRVAENARNYFDKRLEDAQAAGILEHGVENYIRRVFEKDSAWKDAKLSELQFLSTGKPGFARQRIFETDADAARAGLKPIQDFAERVLIYDQELNRAIADRKLVKTLMERKMDDGRPMIDVAGTGSKVEGPGGDAILIKPQFKPKDTSPANNRTDYRVLNHPAFRKWKWVVDQDGTPVMVQGDVLIHPKGFDQMQKLLGRSAVKAHRFAGPALRLSSGVKQTMLDLSGFHQVQIGVHALEHRVFPSKTIGNLVEIDLKNPVHKGLVEHGLTVFEESGFVDFSEGLHGNSAISRIPGLGTLTDAYHNWLFKEFIPTVKMTMAVHALERNRKVYPKYTEDQLLKRTADQSNAAFGGQNWKMQGFSETEVDLLRMAFLAPDFLIARAKFVGQAVKPGGAEQLTALLLGAATLYTTARIANTVISGNPHWEKENMFSIVHNNHAYSLRTIQGDILHLLAKPGQFWYHRVNPTLVKPLIEAVTGRNYFGRKVTLAEIGLDLLMTPIPISLQGLVGGRDQNLIESALNAFGFQTKRFSAAMVAFKLAEEWKEKNKVKGEPGEFLYDPKKDPLHDLKSALQYQDTQKAADELQKVIDSGAYTMAKLDSYFVRYQRAPFAGSAANEQKFIASLNEGDAATIAQAREQRRKMFQDYKAAKSLLK